MRFQLVLQFPGTSQADYGALIRLEDKLIETLEDSCDVDGHDIGLGGANIFVLTDDPQHSLAKALPILESHKGFSSMRAAYRAFDDDEYTVLWPRDFQGKFAVR